MSADGDDATDTDARVASGAHSGQGRVPTVNAANASLSSTDLAVLSHALATNDSDLLNRYNAARNAGMAFGGDRDYYETLGYDRDPTAEQYLTKYLRNDIARRIVDAPVNASWRDRPTIVDDADAGSEDEAETDFEKAVEYLFDEHRALHYIKRADKLTGVGEYGLLFLGLAEDDESDVSLADPATESDYQGVLETKEDSGPDDLAYLATFSQARVTGMETVNDPTNPRYGLPEVYDIEFSNDNGSRTERVHHTRVIHIAEDLLENEIYGRPRLEPVLNRLDDLEKVLGGSAEMFWRGADRKLQLDYQGEGRPNDMRDLAEKAEEMNHGLRNVVKTRDTDINQIGGEDVDPSGVVEQELKHVAGTVGIPLRMLTGSERGELASTQDRATFYERIQERREQFCEPQILRPLLDRLMLLGILPDPRGDSYTVEWGDLFSLNELEQAQLEKERSKALKQAAPMGDPAQLATVAEIRENVFSWSPERGSESSLDAEEGGAAPGDAGEGEEGDITDETAEDREAFEDVFGDELDAEALVEQAREA
jgi:hypothetical protein